MVRADSVRISNFDGGVGAAFHSRFAGSMDNRHVGYGVAVRRRAATKIQIHSTLNGACRSLYLVGDKLGIFV